MHDTCILAKIQEKPLRRLSSRYRKDIAAKHMVVCRTSPVRSQSRSMIRQGHYIVLSVAAAFELMVFTATTCRASLVVLALPDFNEEHLVAEPGDNAGDMSPESADPLAQENAPADPPINPIRLTARKGITPTGSSSSSSSSPSPTSGASSSVLCDIATDHEMLAEDEQSARLYAEAAVFIPNAVHSRPSARRALPSPARETTTCRPSVVHSFLL